MSVKVPGADLEAPALRGEFHRVLDQVPKDLLQARRIGFERNFLRGEIRLEGELLLVDICLANFERVPQERMGIDLFQAQLHFAFADPSQVEQVVDQARLELDVAANHL